MSGVGGYQPFCSARRRTEGLVPSYPGHQAAEAEVEGVLDPGPGEGRLVAPAGGGHALDLGAAWEAQAEYTGALVEGLAGGVVAGASEEGVAAVVLHQHEVGVAAGRDQAEEGEAGAYFRVGVLKPGGVDVAFEVVHAEEGQAGGEGKALCGVDADEQRAGEAGAVRDGDAVELGQLDSGVLQGPADHGDYGEEVLPGGGLGDDAAEVGVEIGLGGDYVGHYAATVLDDGYGGLVAGGLDAQDPHGAVTGGRCRRRRPRRRR